MSGKICLSVFVSLQNSPASSRKFFDLILNGRSSEHDLCADKNPKQRAEKRNV